MKPLIGVTPHYESTEGTIGVRPAYFPALQHVGGLSVIHPMTDGPSDLGQLLKGIDRLLLTGGADVDPALYGERCLPATHHVFRNLDDFELALVRLVLEMPNRRYLCAVQWHPELHVGNQRKAARTHAPVRGSLHAASDSPRLQDMGKEAAHLLVDGLPLSDVCCARAAWSTRTSRCPWCHPQARHR